jgi:hypothetical protein
VRDRSHARRDRLRLPAEATGIAATLPQGARDGLDAAMRDVIAAATRQQLPTAARARLEQAVATALANMPPDAR